MFERRAVLTYVGSAGSGDRPDDLIPGPAGPVDAVGRIGPLPPHAGGCWVGVSAPSHDPATAPGAQTVERRPGSAIAANGPAAFNATFVEGAPSAETVAMLLRTDPSSLPRADLIAGSIGIEKATRMLAAVGAVYHAAAGPAPTGDEVDEVAHEISAATGLHPVATTNRVDLEREVVRSRPLTLRRLYRGELTWRQVERVQRLLAGLDDDTATAVEHAAVPGDPTGLARRLATALARLAPDHVEKKSTKVNADRSVLHWSDRVGGEAGVEIQGPLTKVAQIKAAIDMRAKHRHPDDDRPIAARRFDVLYHWAREMLGLEPTSSPHPHSGEHSPMSTTTVPARSTAEASPAPEGHSCPSCGRTGPAKIPINVTVSLATLLRLSEDPGELDGHPIPAAIARELAADGRWRRMAYDDSGKLSDVGHHTYVPSAAMARYVRARDRTCRFPHCTRPAERCDLDHTKTFHGEGGLTCSGNLASLCRHHHRLKHETPWTYEARDSGEMTWTAASGRTYTSPTDDYYEDLALSRRIATANAWLKKRRSQPTRRTGPRTRRRDPWIAPPDGTPEGDLPF